MKRRNKQKNLKKRRKKRKSLNELPDQKPNTKCSSKQLRVQIKISFKLTNPKTLMTTSTKKLIKSRFYRECLICQPRLQTCSKFAIFIVNSMPCKKLINSLKRILTWTVNTRKFKNCSKSIPSRTSTHTNLKHAIKSRLTNKSILTRTTTTL